MGLHLLRRLANSGLALLGVIFVVILLGNLSGDPAALMVSPDAPNADAVIASLKRELGYDRPVVVQFARMAGRIVRGDFGESVRERRPAIRVVTERLPATFALATIAFALAAAVGIPMGAVGAIRRGQPTDRIAMIVSLLGLTLPSFWLSMLLILFFAQTLGWLPAFGGGTARHLVLPALALAPYSAAIIARVTRSSLLDVMNRDYIRTARAKGLAEALVLYRHALKNAALPIVTMLGLRAGYLLSGSIIIETVFAYPGAGQLVMQAVQWRDLPIVTAFVTVFAAIIIAVNILVDMLYVYLDPTVRLTREGT